MMSKELKKNKFLAILRNSYTIISIIFLIWILFFDENTHLNREFDKEIEEHKTTINFYKKEVNRDKKTIQMLQDSVQLERFAREKYLMKKKNEDVYIIEFDTLKK